MAFRHDLSGSLPVPQSHIPSAHNPLSLGVLNGDTSGELPQFPLFSSFASRYRAASCYVEVMTMRMATIEGNWMNWKS